MLLISVSLFGSFPAHSSSCGFLFWYSALFSWKLVQILTSFHQHLLNQKLVLDFCLQRIPYSLPDTFSFSTSVSSGLVLLFLQCVSFLVSCFVFLTIYFMPLLAVYMVASHPILSFHSLFYRFFLYQMLHEFWSFFFALSSLNLVFS